MTNHAALNRIPFGQRSCPIFDDADVRYLAAHLTATQLRHELASHNVRRACHAIREWPKYTDRDDFFFADLGEACRRALQLLTNPNPSSKVNYGGVLAADVKTKVDILAVSEKYTPLKKTGRTYNGLCPFHTEKHGSFTVYPESQSWYCFSCHRGGDVVTLVMLIEKVNFKSALGLLNGGSL